MINEQSPVERSKIVQSGVHFGKLSASFHKYMENKTPWFVYLLLCDNKDFYVGITNNLNKRILQHRFKISKATKEYSDIKLIYCEQYSTVYDAAKREKQLKGWSHAKKQMLIDGKLGINTCTEFAVALLSDENRVSLP